MTSTPSPLPAAETISAPAADLCLDFANTRMWRGTDAPQETLHRLADVLAWCAGRGLPTGSDGTEEAAFAEILAARETLYRLFSAIAAGRPATEADLRALSHALAATPARRTLTLVAAPPGYAWSVPAPEPGAGALLTPILWSAGDLLVSRRLERVRQCANSQCLWLFLDDSKSGNRRWCSMSACGNRAKAHRHYLRHKDG